MPTLSTNSGELLPDERKILQVKYASLPFAKLTPQEQHGHSLGLLLKINVVTGWPVPDSKEERNILTEQLKLYLVENWPLYNVDEIMYAVRSYATAINNWGKNMNLSLIGSAMVEYEKERLEISKLEESKAMKPQDYNLLTMPADWKELCELNYQQFLTGEYKLELWPWEMYDEFVRCEMMAADAYEDYLTAAYKSIISKDCATNEEREKMLEIKTQFLNHPQVIEGAKRLAVVKLYIHAKKQGFKNLFVKA